MCTANLISGPIAYKVFPALNSPLCHEFRWGNQAIITSTIDGCEWWASYLDRCIRRGKGPGCGEVSEPVCKLWRRDKSILAAGDPTKIRWYISA